MMFHLPRHTSRSRPAYYEDSDIIYSMNQGLSPMSQHFVHSFQYPNHYPTPDFFFPAEIKKEYVEVQPALDAWRVAAARKELERMDPFSDVFRPRNRPTTTILSRNAPVGRGTHALIDSFSGPAVLSSAGCHKVPAGLRRSLLSDFGMDDCDSDFYKIRGLQKEVEGNISNLCGKLEKVQTEGVKRHEKFSRDLQTNSQIFQKIEKELQEQGKTFEKILQLQGKQEKVMKTAAKRELLTKPSSKSKKNKTDICVNGYLLEMTPTSRILWKFGKTEDSGKKSAKEAVQKEKADVRSEEKREEIAKKDAEENKAMSPYGTLIDMISYKDDTLVNKNRSDIEVKDPVLNEKTEHGVANMEKNAVVDNDQKNLISEIDTKENLILRTNTMDGTLESARSCSPVGMETKDNKKVEHAEGIKAEVGDVVCAGESNTHDKYEKVSGKDVRKSDNSVEFQEDPMNKSSPLTERKKKTGEEANADLDLVIVEDADADDCDISDVSQSSLLLAPREDESWMEPVS